VEHAEPLGHPRGHWAALSRRATLAALPGDLDAAAALAAEALEIGREIGVPDADGCFGTTMVSLIIQGRPAQLEPLPADDPIAALAPPWSPSAGLKSIMGRSSARFRCRP
jgi:hypothetical protein